MSILNELIKSALKQFKVKTPTNEIRWDREPTGDDGWDVIKYYSTSNDDRETRERIGMLNDLEKEKVENRQEN